MLNVIAFVLTLPVLVPMWVLTVIVSIMAHVLNVKPWGDDDAC